MRRYAGTMSRLIDLSHIIEAGMVTYPGLPDLFCRTISRIDSRANYEPGTEFLIGRIDMVGNTGTYLDTPFHRFDGGADLAGLALDDVADLPGLCIDAPGPEIDPEAVEGLDLTGRAVLFATGWDRHWGTDAYGDPSHSFVSATLVDALVDGGAVLVGIDSVNIDDTWGAGGRTRPARCRHPGGRAFDGPGSTGGPGFRFYAVPPKVSGFGTFPVRALRLHDERY